MIKKTDITASEVLSQVQQFQQMCWQDPAHNHSVGQITYGYSGNTTYYYGNLATSNTSSAY